MFDAFFLNNQELKFNEREQLLPYPFQCVSTELKYKKYFLVHLLALSEHMKNNATLFVII